MKITTLAQKKKKKKKKKNKYVRIEERRIEKFRTEHEDDLRGIEQRIMNIEMAEATPRARTLPKEIRQVLQPDQDGKLDASKVSSTVEDYLLHRMMAITQFLETEKGVKYVHLIHRRRQMEDFGRDPEGSGQSCGSCGQQRPHAGLGTNQGYHGLLPEWLVAQLYIEGLQMTTYRETLFWSQIPKEILLGKPLELTLAQCQEGAIIAMGQHSANMNTNSQK